MGAEWSDAMEDLGCASPRKDQGYVQVLKPAPAESIDDAFDKAVAECRRWRPVKPLSNDERSMLYALEMQATVGDVHGKRPPMYRPDERARWYAWAQLEGDLTQEQAKRAYIEEVRRLLRLHGTKA
mmetsp:Transcript_4587/g.12189  ORF Transcript_4587/g.12189 Transcript_4587/m.12189 type:complete len:126 (+) Transcript_4587:39-416(+)